MDAVLLDDIKVSIDIPRMSEKWHVRKDSPFADEIDETFEYAQKLIKPKAVIKEIFGVRSAPGGAMVEGRMFEIPILEGLLAGAKRTFVYAATSGDRPEDKDKVVFDSLWSMYLSDAVYSAIDALRAYIFSQCPDDKNLDYVAPGDTEGWDVIDSCYICSLLGDDFEKIGATIDERGILRPLDSICGIFYTH